MKNWKLLRLGTGGYIRWSRFSIGVYLCEEIAILRQTIIIVIAIAMILIAVSTIWKVDAIGCWRAEICAFVKGRCSRLFGDFTAIQDESVNSSVSTGVCYESGKYDFGLRNHSGKFQYIMTGIILEILKFFFGQRLTVEFLFQIFKETIAMEKIISSSWK